MTSIGKLYSNGQPAVRHLQAFQWRRKLHRPHNLHTIPSQHCLVAGKAWPCVSFGRMRSGFMAYGGRKPSKPQRSSMNAGLYSWTSGARIPSTFQNEPHLLLRHIHPEAKTWGFVTWQSGHSARSALTSVMSYFSGESLGANQLLL